MAIKALSEDALPQVSRIFLNVATHMVCLYVCREYRTYNYVIHDLPADEASDVIKIPAVVIIAFNFTAKAEHKRTVRQTKILSNFTESVHQYRIVS